MYGVKSSVEPQMLYNYVEQCTVSRGEYLNLRVTQLFSCSVCMKETDELQSVTKDVHVGKTSLTWKTSSSAASLCDKTPKNILYGI